MRIPVVMAVHMIIRVDIEPEVYGTTAGKVKSKGRPGVHTRPALTGYFFLLGLSSALRSPRVYCMPASRWAAMFGIP